MADFALDNPGLIALVPQCYLWPCLLTLTLILLLSVTGCSTVPVYGPSPIIMPKPIPMPPQAVPDRPAPESMLRAEIQDWLGTPHRLGGLSHRGIDCSGLVMILYEKLFDLQLPRSSTDMMGVGQKVALDRLIPGDLVFFRPKRRVSHVGIYLGEEEFVHTSTTAGVIISRMDDDFWQQCYVTSRRLL